MFEFEEDEKKQVPFEELEHRAVVAEKRAVAAKKNVIKTFSEIATAALDALADRGILFLTLLLSVGMWLWAMAEPSALRLIAAGVCTGMTFLPTLFKGNKNGD